MTLVLMACALGCVFISLLMGAVAALYYIPEVGTAMAQQGGRIARTTPSAAHHVRVGMDFSRAPRPACYAYLFHRIRRADARSEKQALQGIQMILVGHGRGSARSSRCRSGSRRAANTSAFTPPCRCIIAAGWVLFAWTFFSVACAKRILEPAPSTSTCGRTGIVYVPLHLRRGARLPDSVRCARQPVVDLAGAVEVVWNAGGGIQPDGLRIADLRGGAHDGRQAAMAHSTQGVRTVRHRRCSIRSPTTRTTRITFRSRT